MSSNPRKKKTTTKDYGNLVVKNYIPQREGELSRGLNLKVQRRTKNSGASSASSMGTGGASAIMLRHSNVTTIGNESGEGSEDDASETAPSTRLVDVSRKTSQSDVSACFISLPVTTTISHSVSNADNTYGQRSKTSLKFSVQHSFFWYENLA